MDQQNSNQSSPYNNNNNNHNPNYNHLQFPITNPNPNSTPNFNSVPITNPNPNPISNSIPNHFSIPTKRRRGRPRNTSSLYQVYNNFPNLASPNLESPNLESSRFPNRTLNYARKQAVATDVSDEIIDLNKEPTSEALTALTVGFPADSLTDEEIEAKVVNVVGGIEQINYILIRNHIITKWRENVSTWITKEMFVDVIPKHCSGLLDSAYNYLLSRGYINFGVAPAVKDKIPAEASKGRVIIIGAGLAGLAAARQLMSFGFKVIVLEGRKRAGGRVYTKKMEGGNKVAAADLGGSVLTGTSGNPLGLLARQLSYTLHKVRDKCPLYRVDGKPVDKDLDDKVEAAYNRLLDKASKLRQLMGDVSQDVSLGAALDTFREVLGDAVSDEEMGLFNWHLANLEYANAGLLSKLSLAFWDQDDPYDMGGDHCFLPGGNGRLVQALAENVPIVFGRTVNTIRYGSDGVQVVAGAQVFEGDMALCTVPLGVLKSGSIKFIPELPQRKLDAIKRLGFGLLNKVAMLFPYVFWDTNVDTFGHVVDDPSCRGEFFLFFSYATVAGGPLLIALVAGEAAHKFEVMPPTDAVTRVLQILKGIFEPQGIEVPEPIQTVCTRWGSDPFSFGAYSNVAVGASGDDYDILAETVGEGRLFFAGEATTRRYPATMHGAFLTGLREAANMAHHASVRTSNLMVEKKPSTNAHSHASLLADLFREPDLEFGSFSVIFAGKRSDFKSTAILRMTINESQKTSRDLMRSDQHHSNKSLFQQLQSHFNHQQELHIYTLLSKKQALELREVRGGDEMRLNFLSEKLGVKLIGRKGLGASADLIIASIKADRGRRKPGSNSLALKSGLAKSKATTLKRKVVRKAKIVGRGNGTTSSAGDIRTKLAGSSLSSTPLANANLASPPVCNTGSAGDSRTKLAGGSLSSTPPANANLASPPVCNTGSAGDIRTKLAGSSLSSTPPGNANLASSPVCNTGSAGPPSLNILVSDNIESQPGGSSYGSMRTDSSTCYMFGVGVTGWTPPNPGVGGIILADGSGSVNASNTYEDSTGTWALPPNANSGGS